MWDLIVSVPDHCLSFYFTHPFIRTNAANKTKYLKYMGLSFLLQKYLKVEKYVLIAVHAASPLLVSWWIYRLTHPFIRINAANKKKYLKYMA